VINGVFHRWTAAELKNVIAMLQNPEFNSKNIDPDLHQRMTKAVNDGNASPTIPHKYRKNKSSCFRAGCADTAAEDGRSGSNVYEVDTWLWMFGRGKPWLGSLTIEETLDRQDSASKASDKHRKETSDGSKDDGA
jgi:hypothetical protein